MTCYYPVQAFRSRFINTKSGKRPLVFKKEEGLTGSDCKINCGRCIGCKLKKSREWAVRIMHEVQMTEEKDLPSIFVTLTFNEDGLRSQCVNDSLDVEHLQLFNKRLLSHRKRVYFKQLRSDFPDADVKYLAKLAGEKAKFRFYAVGEYGEVNMRPHYHIIYFGFDFDDKYFFRNRRDGHKLYRSPTLEKLWPYGYSSIGSVTFDSAAYVARYCMKKVNGKVLADRYWTPPDENGEVFAKKKEFNTMSRRPGIARDWYEKFGIDALKKDEVFFKKLKLKPPKYYSNLFAIDFPAIAEKFKLKAEEYVKSLAFRRDNTDDRLEVRRSCKEFQITNLKRGLMDEDFFDDS